MCKLYELSKSYQLKRKIVNNYTTYSFECINIDIIKIYFIDFDNYEYTILFINKGICEYTIFIYKDKKDVKKTVQFMDKYMKIQYGVTIFI